MMWAGAHRVLRRPVFPVLFAAYPSLFLFVQNRGQLDGSELAVPLAASLLGVLLVWGSFALLRRSAAVSAVATTAALAVFFGFGALRSLVPDSMQAGVVVPLAVWALGLGVAIAGVLWAASRYAAAVESLIPVLNVAAFVLVAMPIVSLLAAGSPIGRQSADRAWNADDGKVPGVRPVRRPDIYHIVLDGYGQHGTLQSRYGYDNGPFRRHLEERGFTIVSESRANYLRTIHSIATMHNLAYVPDSAVESASDPHDLRPLADGIRNSRLLKILGGLGYSTWAFESGYAATELTTVDHFLESEGSISEFESAVLNLTPIGVALSLLPASDQFDLHRRRILDTLDALPRVAAEPGPKFVFAHLLAPHPPFVFRRDGAPAPVGREYSLHDGVHFLRGRKRSDYLEGYAAQVEFITGRVQIAIDGILENASRPSWIVLQGDHGPGSNFRHEFIGDSDLAERSFILNAVRPPGGRPVRLPPDLSPINTLRWLLATSFRLPLPRLEERTWYNPESWPYRFEDVTDRVGPPLGSLPSPIPEG